MKNYAIEKNCKEFKPPKIADDALSIFSILKVESHNFGIDWSRGAELQRTLLLKGLKTS